MNRSIRRTLSITVAVATLTVTGLTASASEAQPAVPSQNVMPMSPPDGVGAIDPADQCSWLKGFMASITAAVAQALAASGRPITKSEAADFGMLIGAPIVAAVCLMAGK